MHSSESLLHKYIYIYFFFGGGRYYKTGNILVTVLFGLMISGMTPCCSALQLFVLNF